MGFDYETWKAINQHQEWLGFLQPVGLVVSPTALINHSAYVDRDRAVDRQQTLSTIVTTDRETNTVGVASFETFAEKLLEWMPEQDLLSPPTDIELVLSDYEETLSPTYAVPVAPDQGDGWLLLVKTLDWRTDFDTDETSGWEATPQEKFERLLRAANIPIGVLWNGTQLRLVYAPIGESSGYVTFPLEAMMEVAGRSILGALVMLLGADRLFTVPSDRRLPQLLIESRRYQNAVSERLAEQVLDALWELLRGFQQADGEQAKVSDETVRVGYLANYYPQHIYGGLVTTLMRLVFLLYAEERDIMPTDSIYQRYYAVGGLYEKLRTDAGNYPDTMDQRYGAWSWLLSLFRLVYDGGGHYPDYLPARHGQLFDPDEYPFLEGRPLNSSFRDYPTIIAPRIPDGVVFRILDNLLVLEGERLSYRALDVEQIGSVYEGIMGYRVEVAQHDSIAVHSKPQGAKIQTAVVIDLEALQETQPKERSKTLKEWANCELSTKPAKALKEAQTQDEIIAALEKKISKRTPNTLPPGALYLQPTQERRRSGSHYTPRSLTAPVVETTLQPVFQKLGEKPTPEQLLSLKVCDFAMGSGAFLVEACRQIADRLVEAWERTDAISPDTEEPVVIARRFVAQQCIYGVDKNPFAVNLAKLSLWLFTLSRDRPFTFLDHALKCGDSLVGLTRSEIGEFARDPTADAPLMQLLQNIDQVKNYRMDIQTSDSRSDEDDTRKRQQLDLAEQELENARLSGDLAVAAFFDAEKKTKTAKKQKKTEYQNILHNDASQVKQISQQLRQGETAINVFNWEIEFPEVFDRENPGFDAIVGNPPFLGGKKISTVHGSSYLAWLTENYPESKGSPDLVAFFFRRAFNLLCKQGAMGLIATNTIAQGGTRSAGLRFICNNGGIIYNAKRRYKWPGLASVVVSVIHIVKQSLPSNVPILLDEKTVEQITAFLVDKGGNDDPYELLANEGKSFIGSYILGMGFTFDDSNPNATPISEMYRLIEKNPKNQEVIFPYIGGEEVNSSPTHAYYRYVIDFFDREEKECWENYPDLMQIVYDKVKPERDKQKRKALRERWWQYADKRPGLKKAIASCDRVLVCSRVNPNCTFAFLPANWVYAESLVVFKLESYSAFALLQNRIHEIWARFLSGTAMDLLRYAPSDCFETFPFPKTWETDSTLEQIGETYYNFRADLMVRNNEGLTDTYNRFHNPDETDSDIQKLRQLHDEMDRAVLNAYGWDDLEPTCDFLLDYEDEDDNSDRKKPYRYRWTDEFQDEVLARLLDLNKQRHEEETLRGDKPQKTTKSRKGGKKKKKQESTGSLNLDYS